MSTELSSDPELRKVAYVILSGFDKSFRRHLVITKGAQQRFEQANWVAAQQAMKERIGAYEKSLNEVVAQIYQLFSPQLQSFEYWQALKKRYLSLLNQHPQYELAETFYNSVIGRIFKHQKIDDDMIFLLSGRCFLPGQDRHKVVNKFSTQCTVREMLDEIFEHYHFNIAYQDKERDLQHLDRALRQRMTRTELASVFSVEMLKPVFYRSKAAYLVGCIRTPQTTIPFVISLMLNRQKQLYVDALLTKREDLSVIFGFARAYFMADSQYPGEIVAFLHELLPNKKQFELYISLGLYKHGKTVFYRNYLQHLENSEDLFEVAPGIRGLVMAVFHLPSYGVVFKIIKDEFGESKKFGREHVLNRYRLVKMSDRVGRMADTHEYVNFHLPRHRVSAELLEELQQVAASSIELTEQHVIIKHLYIERKMTPLNIFLQQEQDEQKIHDAIDELGRCIKQIAAAHIFPGDMLHKNFGITKHGRVIFYDYDEISLMTEPNFRDLPKSDDPYAIDTLSVAPLDIFPEQFEHFILGKKAFKDKLKALHPELMQPEYWRSLQAQAKTGVIQHFTPYHESQRFRN